MSKPICEDTVVVNIMKYVVAVTSCSVHSMKIHQYENIRKSFDLIFSITYLPEQR